MGTMSNQIGITQGTETIKKEEIYSCKVQTSFRGHKQQIKTDTERMKK